MKRKVGLLLGGALLIAGLSATPAVAAPISGLCVGQTTSYTAQGNDISPFVSANGIGNVAAANSVTTKDAMGYIKFVVC
jgi:acyl-homoserine lactone acylase PvdQ